MDLKIDFNKEFSKRLKNLLEKYDMNQKELADKLYVTEATISRYIKGERLPKMQVIQEIAKIFNVTANYLLGFENAELEKAKLKSKTSPPPFKVIDGIMDLPIETHKIPILGSVRAGMLTLISEENTIGYEYITNEMSKLGELFALKINGDSMQPRLYDGDIVIVQRTPDVESGSIGVILVNGDEATVKKIIKSQNGITLVPLNTNYDPIVFTNDDIMSLPVIILGKVIEARRKF